MTPENKPEQSSLARQIGLFSVILADLVGFSGAGIGLGYYLWKKQGAPWWVLLLCSVTGLGLAFYRLYQAGRRL